MKAQVFLTNLDDFAGFDQVWKRYFKVPPPRTTVGTTGSAGAGNLVEIDLIGYVPRSGLKHEVIKSGAPRPLANYSEAFTIGDFVFAAGQIASDYKTGVPSEARKHPNFPYYGSDIKLSDRLYSQQPEADLRSRGQFARQRREGAGVHDRFEELLRDSTRSGRSISKSHRRARRSAPAACW